MNSAQEPEAHGSTHDDLLAIDRDDVKASVQYGQMVTVVSISGDVDGNNADGLSAFVTRSILVGNPVLLDLSRVEFFAVQSISLLTATDNACSGTNLPWALVASPAVNRVLRYSRQRNDALPIASSVSGAMEYFAHLAYMQARPRTARGLLPLSGQNLRTDVRHPVRTGATDR